MLISLNIMAHAHSLMALPKKTFLKNKFESASEYITRKRTTTSNASCLVEVKKIMFGVV